jgi:putative membrane protein
MTYYGDHMSGWGWFAMSVSMFLFSGLVITAIVLLVRYVRGTGEFGQPRDTPTPEQLLVERFCAWRDRRDRISATDGHPARPGPE